MIFSACACSIAWSVQLLANHAELDSSEDSRSDSEQESGSSSGMCTQHRGSSAWGTSWLSLLDESDFAEEDAPVVIDTTPDEHITREKSPSKHLDTTPIEDTPVQSSAQSTCDSETNSEAASSANDKPTQREPRSLVELLTAKPDKPPKVTAHTFCLFNRVIM